MWTHVGEHDVRRDRALVDAALEIVLFLDEADGSTRERVDGFAVARDAHVVEGEPLVVGLEVDLDLRQRLDAGPRRGLADDAVVMLDPGGGDVNARVAQEDDHALLGLTRIDG